jgi:hypothetical protein
MDYLLLLVSTYYSYAVAVVKTKRQLYDIATRTRGELLVTLNWVGNLKQHKRREECFD